MRFPIDRLRAQLRLPFWHRADIEAEVQSHLAEACAELAQEGMEPAQAEATALERFGSLDGVGEALQAVHRDWSGGATVRQALRRAIRKTVRHVVLIVAYAALNLASFPVPFMAVLGLSSILPPAVTSFRVIGWAIGGVMLTGWGLWSILVAYAAVRAIGAGTLTGTLIGATAAVMVAALGSPHWHRAPWHYPPGTVRAYVAWWMLASIVAGSTVGGYLGARSLRKAAVESREPSAQDRGSA